MNLLILNAAPSHDLVDLFRKEVTKSGGKLYTAEKSMASKLSRQRDNHFITTADNPSTYLENLLHRCRSYQIDSIFTLSPTDLQFISDNRNAFLNIGTLPIITSNHSIKLSLYPRCLEQFLNQQSFKTKKSYINLSAFLKARNQQTVNFPVWLYSCSNGRRIPPQKINNLQELFHSWSESKQQTIKEIPQGREVEALVYVDLFTRRPVSIFLYQTLYDDSGRIKGTVSLKNRYLFVKIYQFLRQGQFVGMVKLKVIESGPDHYIEEVLPYLDTSITHAHALKINFPAMVMHNASHQANQDRLADYPENHYRMTYSLLPRQISSYN